LTLFPVRNIIKIKGENNYEEPKTLYFCGFLAFSLIFCLCACDGFEFPDYNYSDDGKTEVEYFFSSLNNNQITSHVSFSFRTEDGDYLDIDYYRLYDAQTQTAKKLYKMDHNGDIKGCWKGGEDKYVIDYVQKTVTAHQSAIDEITRQKEYYVDFLGKVSFEEGDIEAWAFEEKSARTIEDKDGEEIETVQFKYAYQGDRYYVKSLCVDFDKKFFIVRRMTYEIYTDAQKQQVESVHAFIVYEGTDVDDTFFELPDEGEYTFLNEEEEN